MIIPLNPDKKDPIIDVVWQSSKVIDSRAFQQKLSRNGLKNIRNYQNLFKMLLLSMYFKLNVFDVYKQFITDSKLFKFLNIGNLQDLKQIKRLYSWY